MKLIILSGPSGSGKSGRARELRAADPSLCYLAFDNFLKSYSRPERIIAELIRRASLILGDGGSVIIDAVNLHPHDRIRWETVAWAFGIDMTWIALQTPVDECIERDALRADPVGALAIRAQLAMTA